MILTWYPPTTENLYTLYEFNSAFVAYGTTRDKKIGVVIQYIFSKDASVNFNREFF